MTVLGLAVGLLVLLVGGGGPAPPSDVRPAGASGPVRYRAPVQPVRVVHPFDPPATPYGPGHLGVDLAVRPGAVVRAAGAGVVGFAGSVAGRGLVVIRHPDGISTEYEPLRPSVRVGAAVARGQPIGRIAGTHGACPRGRCLHWGAKRDDTYLDPMTLLRPLGPVRLLPWPGEP